MEADAIINILLSAGIPGIVLAVLVYLSHKFVPMFVKAYKDAKEKEQTGIIERQRQHEEQMQKMVEVATKASVSNERVSIAIEQNTRALEQNNNVNQEVVSNLKALNESFKSHDRRAEEINIDVKKILENARRSGKT